MKKMVSALLVLAMVLSMGVPVVSAASGTAPDTLYIDITQVARANETVSSVYLWIRAQGGSVLLSNKMMTHVSGTVYSYDISSVASTAASLEVAIGYAAGSYDRYYASCFSSGKNLYIPSGGYQGLWGIYTDNSKKTHNVTAYYTPSAQAKITGMYITVDGTKYTSSTAENPITIYSDSEMSVTLEGEHFDNMPNYQDSTLAFCWFESQYQWLATGTTWTIDTTDHTATHSFQAASYSTILSQMTEANELKYTNDSTKNEKIGSGIYVVYNSGKKPTDEPARIREVKLKVGGTTYDSGTVTLNSESGNVTIIVSGENFGTLEDGDYQIRYTINNASTVSSSSGWEIDAVAGTATKTFSADDFEDNSTEFGIQYRNNGGDWENGGVAVVYENAKPTAKITSVEITVDGVKYTSSTESEPVKIYSDSEVSITLNGENFDNLPQAGQRESLQVLIRSQMLCELDDAKSGWTVDTANHTATITADQDMMDELANRASVATLLHYTNRDEEGTKDSGIYVIYSSEKNPAANAAKITGMYITIDGTKITSNTAESPVTIYSDSTIEVTLTGVNFDKIAEYSKSDLSFEWFGDNVSKLFAGEDSEWTIDTTNRTATRSFDPTAYTTILEQATEAKELKYSNGAENIGSGIYVIYNSGKNPSPMIKGVSIEVTDGGETIEPVGGVYTISPTSTVKITINGTNLSKLDNSYYLECGADKWGFAQGWTMNAEGTTLTRTVYASMFAGVNNTRIKYYNNNTPSDSDVIVTYDESAAKVKITGMTLTVDGKEYKRGDTVTMTPSTQTVTVTFTGEKLDKASENTFVSYSQYTGEILCTSATFNADGTTATLTPDVVQFTDNTTAFEIVYMLDGLNYIHSGIYVLYQQDTTSVEITWGALSFTYSDEKNDNDEEKGWTCAEGADKIKVTNTGTVAVAITVTYKAADESSPISVELDKQSATLEKDACETFTVTLTGKPTSAMTNQSIGTVTVKIDS